MASTWPIPELLGTAAILGSAAYSGYSDYVRQWEEAEAKTAAENELMDLEARKMENDARLALEKHSAEAQQADIIDQLRRGNQQTQRLLDDKAASRLNKSQAVSARRLEKLEDQLLQIEEKSARHAQKLSLIREQNRLLGNIHTPINTAIERVSDAIVDIETNRNEMLDRLDRVVDVTDRLDARIDQNRQDLDRYVDLQSRFANYAAERMDMTDINTENMVKGVLGTIADKLGDIEDATDLIIEEKRAPSIRQNPLPHFNAVEIAEDEVAIFKRLYTPQKRAELDGAARVFLNAVRHKGVENVLNNQAEAGIVQNNNGYFIDLLDPDKFAVAIRDPNVYIPKPFVEAFLSPISASNYLNKVTLFKIPGKEMGRTEEKVREAYNARVADYYEKIETDRDDERAIVDFLRKGFKQQSRPQSRMKPLYSKQRKPKKPKKKVEDAPDESLI